MVIGREHPFLALLWFQMPLALKHGQKGVQKVREISGFIIVQPQEAEVAHFASANSPKALNVRSAQCPVHRLRRAFRTVHIAHCAGCAMLSKVHIEGPLQCPALPLLVPLPFSLSTSFPRLPLLPPILCRSMLPIVPAATRRTPS